MLFDLEKLIRSEVRRRVAVGHSLYEDLCQEARIAAWEIESKLDHDLPEAQQKSFVKHAIRWRITRAWHLWLRESLLVSVKAIREQRADFSKRVVGEDVLEKVASQEQSPEERTINSHLLGAALESAVQDVRDEKALQGLLAGVSCRTLGERLEMSSQGALNVRRRLLNRIKDLC